VDFDTTSPSNEYEFFDILPNVTDGKSVSYIEFIGDTGQPYLVDLVSLVELPEELTVIEFSCDETNNPSLPKWINQSPDIDKTVWTKSFLEMNYTLRCSDAEKYALEQLQLLHSTVHLYDETYITDPWLYFEVWIKEINATYAGNEDFSKPWRIELKLIVVAKI
jgi:hypothetical protein